MVFHSLDVHSLDVHSLDVHTLDVQEHNLDCQRPSV